MSRYSSPRTAIQRSSALRHGIGALQHGDVRARHGTMRARHELYPGTNFVS